MTSAIARALRLVAVGYALSALTLVFQAAVLRALGYESALFDRVLDALGLVFAAGDVVLFVGVTRLARAAQFLRGLLVPARVCVALTLASGVLGIASRSLGGAAARTALVVSTVALEVSAGGALLVLLAIVTVSRDVHAGAPRTSAAVRLTSIVSGVMIFAPTLLRFWRAVESEPATPSVAWVAFVLEVARPVAIAVFAHLVSRVAAGEGAREVQSPGPYRMADVSVPAASPKAPSLDLSDAHAVKDWRGVVAGLRRYRLAIILRVLVGVGTFCYALFVVEARTDELALSLPIIVLCDLVLAFLQVVAIVTILRLPGSKGFLLVAIAFLALCALCNGLGLVAILDGLSRSTHRAVRAYGDYFVIGVPFGILTSVLSMTFAATALGRAAARLADTEAIERTRWIQGLTVIGATLLVAVLFSMSTASKGQGAGDAVFLAGLALIAATAWFTVVGLHIPLVGRLHRTALALLPAAPGPPAA